MPTDILRRSPRASGGPARQAQGGDAGARLIEVKFDRGLLIARLVASETADRIWQALPLHGTAERWGEAVHFEVPVAGGRDRSARLNGRLGEIYYWPQERRVIIPFGPTPISRPGEMRLPAPVNVLATIDSEAGVLQDCRPGEKVSVARRQA